MQTLFQYLAALANDPAAQDAFGQNPASSIDAADLSDADKAVLRTGNAGLIQATVGQQAAAAVIYASPPSAQPPAVIYASGSQHAAPVIYAQGPQPAAPVIYAPGSPPAAPVIYAQVVYVTAGAAPVIYAAGQQAPVIYASPSQQAPVIYASQPAYSNPAVIYAATSNPAVIYAAQPAVIDAANEPAPGGGEAGDASGEREDK
jgi:hypothetical protein